MESLYNWPMGQNKVEAFCRFVRFNGGHATVSKVKKLGKNEHVNVYFDSKLSKAELLDYLRSI